LYSIVAWDHVSWPGNDFFVGSRATDDGVKAAATNSMSVLTGVKGEYDPTRGKYQPPQPYTNWGAYILRQLIGFRTGTRATSASTRRPLTSPASGSPTLAALYSDGFDRIRRSLNDPPAGLHRSKSGSHEEPLAHRRLGGGNSHLHRIGLRLERFHRMPI